MRLLVCNPRPSLLATSPTFPAQSALSPIPSPAHSNISDLRSIDHTDLFCKATNEQTTKTKRKEMNYRFDELTKSLAQSVTRRAALKKFGVGLAGMALACFGLANKAAAQTSCLPIGYVCKNN